VGDTLYGAPKDLKRGAARAPSRARKSRQDMVPKPHPEAPPSVLALHRNFLHAAALEFTQPRTGKRLALAAPLPEALVKFLDQLGSHQPDA